MAWFQSIIPYFEHVDTFSRDGQFIKYRQLLNAIAGDEGITILSGTQAWRPTAQLSIGVLPVQFSMPVYEQRRACWQENLASAGITLGEGDLETLAGRFRLFPKQIAEVVAICHSRNHRKAFNQTDHIPGRPSSRETLESLFATARSQSGHDLADLACKIDPIYTWDDIVLPEDAFIHLREICLRMMRRQRVLHKWGFDRKLSLGKGCNALFAGPSGTGKTMAAEVIANELNLDLYKIDLAGVVSKYIGETEKNLDRIFTAAENANAILFFDEADALFGKRSEVRDSHDRYANIEISFLLQKMEQFDGLAILATNLRGNLDQAFTRRLAFTVHFPFPDENSRLRIWTEIWPAETPLADDIEMASFARHFKLSGGNIKNIALAAAFLATEETGMVTKANLLQATRREYQKMGKVLSEDELNDVCHTPPAVVKVA
jgi:SpoVK/Ycf46/Vps4 family AAA+-type ATPase